MTLVSEDLPPTTEQVVGRTIRYHREDRLQLSAQELADRVQELGGTLFRQAISKIELGKRAVSIDELMYLARAMEMNPLLLLFPLGMPDARFPTAVMVGGEAMNLWRATQWFTGEGPPPHPREYWADPLYLFREHDSRMGELTHAMAIALFTPSAADEAAEKRVIADHRIRQIRADIRRRGLRPPDLDSDLTYLDELQYKDLLIEEVEAKVLNGERWRIVDDTRPNAGRMVRPGDSALFRRQLGPGTRMRFEGPLKEVDE